MFVAVKIGIADSNLREAEVLSTLTSDQHFSPGSGGHDLILPVLDRFEIRGPNGVHPCYETVPATESVADAKDGSTPVSSNSMLYVRWLRSLSLPLRIYTHTAISTEVSWPAIDSDSLNG